MTSFRVALSSSEKQAPQARAGTVRKLDRRAANTRAQHQPARQAGMRQTEAGKQRLQKDFPEKTGLKQRRLKTLQGPAAWLPTQDKKRPSRTEQQQSETTSLNVRPWPCCWPVEEHVWACLLPFRVAGSVSACFPQG
jgi:hypothetical protein